MLASCGTIILSPSNPVLPSFYPSKVKSGHMTGLNQWTLEAPGRPGMCAYANVCAQMISGSKDERTNKCDLYLHNLQLKWRNQEDKVL